MKMIRKQKWVLAAAVLLAVCAFGQKPAAASAADSGNVMTASELSQRANYKTDLKGVRGIDNGKTGASNWSKKGMAQWSGMTQQDRTYTVSAGTNPGQMWHTETLLPEDPLISTNNPSGTKQTYFAGAPQGYTMDPEGNTYIAFAQRNPAGQDAIYNGYVMKITAKGMSELEQDPLMFRRGVRMLYWQRVNPAAYRLYSGPTGDAYHFKQGEAFTKKLLSEKLVTFSNLIHDFSSGAFAYNPANKTLNYFVAYASQSQSFLASHPVQMVTMSPSSLTAKSETKFTLYDSLSKKYFVPTTLAFDASGNFYAAVQTALTTTDGQAYVLYQGKPAGDSWQVRMMGLSMGPVMDDQMQGISIDEDRFYITGNSDYYSFSLSAYLQAEATHETPTAAQKSALNIEVGRISGNRESENTVSNHGKLHMILTVPTEIIGQGESAPLTAVAASGKKVMYVNYVPGYGIAIWTQPGGGTYVKTASGKTKTLKHGSAYQVFQTKQVGSTTWYCLGGNQWLDGKYLSTTKPAGTMVKERGKVQIHYVPGYGIAIWNSYKSNRQAIKVGGRVKTLKHGTTWQYCEKIYSGGMWWYNLGGNQWLQGTYARPL